jgi:hypothetical protein
MAGVGPIELIVVLIIVVALFGPTLIAFWLGYTVGKRRSQPAPPPQPQPPAPAAPETPTEQASPAEEPADE